MRIFLFFLIFCNLIIPALYVLRNNFKHGEVEIDHMLLFTFGFVFYWIFPIVVGVMRYFENGYTLAPWYEIFDRISDYNLSVYMLSCLTCYIAFIGGDILGKTIFTKNKLKSKRISVDIKLLDILLILGIASAAIFGYTLRYSFFSGYLNSAIFWKGSFSANIAFLLSLAFVYSTEIQERFGEPPEFGNIVFNRFFIASFMGLVLLTSLGGRTFLLSGVAMLLVYRTVFFKRIRLKTFLFFVFAVTIFSTFVPMIRDHTPLKKIFFSDSMLIHIKNISYIFFSDPIFTSFSLIYALKENILPLINFPIFLFSSLVSLIPAFIYPAKAALILTPANYGYPSYSPYGALHSFFYFVINFGVIGTVLGLFLFSLFLSFLKTNKLPVCKSIYIMISGWTAFILFRDPETTIIKLIFEFSILLPILIVLFPTFLSKLTRTKNINSNEQYPNNK